MRRFGIVIGILAVGLAIGGYVFFAGERKAPVRYRTAAVERGSVVSIVSATGTINPVVSVQVGSQVSGMIKSLHADFNSRVKAGDVVAVIDPEPFKARRDQAASNLEMARANVARAQTDGAKRKRELEGVRSLIDQNFVSQNDVDVAVTNAQGAKAQVHVAEAQVRQAEAALNSAELELKYTTIRRDSTYCSWFAPRVHAIVWGRMRARRRSDGCRSIPCRSCSRARMCSSTRTSRAMAMDPYA